MTGLSKNMKFIVARRAQTDAFLLSEEYQEMGRKHIGWLREHGFSEKIIAKYEKQYANPLDYKIKTRKRRGKIVEIPEVWQCVVTHKQTIRKRKSKRGGKRTKMKKSH